MIIYIGLKFSKSLISYNVVAFFFVLALIKSKQGFWQGLVCFKRINSYGGLGAVFTGLYKFVDVLGPHIHAQ